MIWRTAHAPFALGTGGTRACTHTLRPRRTRNEWTGRRRWNRSAVVRTKVGVSTNVRHPKRPERAAYVFGNAHKIVGRALDAHLAVVACAAREFRDRLCVGPTHARCLRREVTDVLRAHAAITWTDIARVDVDGARVGCDELGTTIPTNADAIWIAEIERRAVTRRVETTIGRAGWGRVISQKLAAAPTSNQQPHEHDGCAAHWQTAPPGRFAARSWHMSTGKHIELAFAKS